MPIAAVSFWLLIGLIAAFGMTKAVSSDTLDPDLFWHLRVADQLRHDGIGPIVDHLSFSSIKEPWTPYSWLAELGMRWVWDVFGWRGAVAGEALLVAGTIISIALSCLELAGPQRRLNCVVATALGAYLAIPFISFRPVSMAMFLLSICAWLLLRDRRQRSGWVWLVVPLTAVLTNIHLCVIFVPVWTGCLLAGAVWQKKNIKRHAVLFAASCLAALLTPMLPGALRTAWYYQSNDVIVAQRDFIAEMQPLWLSINGWLTIAVAAAIVGFALFRQLRTRPGEVLCLIADAILMLRLTKFVPMFATIGAPMTAAMMSLSDRVLRKPTTALALGVVLLLGLLRIAMTFPSSGTPMNQWINRRISAYPTAAADYVAANVTPRTGRVINEFNWGGYLAWRLGDRYQVFLDGRTQVFAPQFWKQTYLSTERETADVIRAANADVAVIPKAKSQFRKPLESLGWKRVERDDDIADVYLPPN